MQCLQQALVNRKGPIFLRDDARLHVAQPMLQKWNELCCEVLSHLPYSPDFWPTDYHFFKDLNNFLQGQRFHNQQEAENAFQEFVKSQSMDFYATGISKLTSHWQSMLIAMVPILTNKDVFEPSYNDLKSMDQNCNYFCTNLTVYQC